MWRAWHEAGAIPAGVRLAISAGAPLPLALEAAVFAARGLKIRNVLGASECGGIGLRHGRGAPHVTPAPRASPSRGVTLGRTSGLPGGDRVPACGTGYWPTPQDGLRGGRYRTRDLVEFAPDGGVLLRGRADDIINALAGRKVMPEAIELVLRQCAGVRECLVLGVPADEQRGEAVAAVVETDPALTMAALREFALAHLPAWQVPRHWQRVEALAPNGRGKLSRAEWRAKWSMR
jgi:acyl-coenzyme A synthetase/AMP-(fatty) acid ligase